MKEGYDIAQICLNGHVINSFSSGMPEFNKKYCDQCGEFTIIECQECKNPIRGDYWGSMSMTTMTAPKFCLNCGKPFEWTIRKLNAAKELAALSEGFTGDEIIEFQKSIDNLVINSPNIEVAKVKYIKFVKKAGTSIAQGLKDILVDIVSETIKKTIWNDPK
ncbi:MAG TPA: DUF2321 domain-containing protein [Ignavibacteria bacterium]